MTAERGDEWSAAIRSSVKRVATVLAAVLVLYIFLIVIGGWQGAGASAVFLPAVILLLAYLASSLARLNLRGSLSVPISRSCLVVGVAAAFLVLVVQAGGDAARTIGIVMVTSAAAVVSVLFMLQRRRMTTGGLILRAVAILLVGADAYLAAGISNFGPLQSLGPIALASSFVTALIALFPLMTGSGNRAARWLASSTARNSNIIGLGLIVFIFSSYFLALRPLVSTEAAQALSVLEWSMVVVAFAFVGAFAYLYLKDSSHEIEFGEWRAQNKTLPPDRAELEPASAAVREFVEEGRMEALLVAIVGALKANKVPDDSVERIVARLLEYREDEPRLMQTKQNAARMEKEMGERRKLVREVLGMCATVAGISAGQESPPRATLAEGGIKVGDR